MWQHNPQTPQCHRMQPRPQASVWPLLAPRATDITDTDCDGTMDPDMVPSNSLGIVIVRPQVAAQATQIVMAMAAE